MRPESRRKCLGVLDLLKNDDWREAHKDDLNLIDKWSGLPVWAIRSDFTFVEFIETLLEVEVAHIVLLSGFGGPADGP